MLPQIISGNALSDERGILYYNNNFNALIVKRLYFIENSSTDFIRAWQGHKIEQRWFSAAIGSFEIKLIAVDNWESPSVNLEQHIFELSSKTLDVLHIPAGYVSSIKALTDEAKLLVMADYGLGEIKDEYRYDDGYFDKKK
jgi:dTDP-4-dehydrorhamnose 3,5-epimerase-like enzyme